MEIPKYSEVYEFENLYQAYKIVIKEHRFYKKQLQFTANLEENLIELQNELIWHEYKPKEYNTFIVKDPKERVISAPDIRDRIIQTAICNIVEPWIEKQFDFSSYACRKNKGALAAGNRVSFYMGKPSAKYYLYGDVKHFFYSVDIAKLETLLAERFITDKDILQVLHEIMWKDCNGKGLKIGGRWNQLAANIVLNEMDFFVRQKLHAKYYVRYMDDFIIFDNSKSKLNKYKVELQVFLKENLSLQLNNKTSIDKASNGVTFVGYRIKPNGRVIRKIALDKAKSFTKGWMAGKINNEDFINGMASRVGHCVGTASYKWYCALLLKCMRFMLTQGKAPSDQHT